MPHYYLTQTVVLVLPIPDSIVQTHILTMSPGARTSPTPLLPLEKITPFPRVTRVSSRALAHQFLRSLSPAPPTTGEYATSNTAPFLIAVRTRVCLKKNGMRGSVSGREMMCVVSVEGTECVRQAAEKVERDVGCSERISYVCKRASLFLVCSHSSLE